jgi:V/A-type H+/Na+-transporting ATPase subunit E
MPEARLQELIDILKQQGVKSGEETARQIVADANRQAEEALTKARGQAEEIMIGAKEEAERLKRQLQASLEIAASQFVTQLKRAVEQQLLQIPLKEKIGEDLSDPDFLKGLMTKFVEAYAANPQNPPIELLMQEDAAEELWDFAVKLIGSHYRREIDKDLVKIRMESAGIGFGFMVDRRAGNVLLDFTDEAFLTFFLRYLSPGFRKLFKAVKAAGAGN